MRVRTADASRGGHTLALNEGAVPDIFAATYPIPDREHELEWHGSGKHTRISLRFVEKTVGLLPRGVSGSSWNVS